jgi:hypothetical protein
MEKTVAKINAMVVMTYDLDLVRAELAEAEAVRPSEILDEQVIDHLNTLVEEDFGLLTPYVLYVDENNQEIDLDEVVQS